MSPVSHFPPPSCLSTLCAKQKGPLGSPVPSLSRRWNMKWQHNEMSLVSLRFQIAVFFFFFSLIQPETYTMVQTAEVGQCCRGLRECGKRSEDKVPTWFRLGQQAQEHIRGLRKSWIVHQNFWRQDHRFWLVLLEIHPQRRLSWIQERNLGGVVTQRWEIPTFSQTT